MGSSTEATSCDRLANKRDQQANEKSFSTLNKLNNLQWKQALVRRTNSTKWIATVTEIIKAVKNFVQRKSYLKLENLTGLIYSTQNGQQKALICFANTRQKKNKTKNNSDTNSRFRERRLQFSAPSFNAHGSATADPRSRSRTGSISSCRHCIPYQRDPSPSREYLL